MKISVYQDRYNAIKTWEVEINGDVYYLSQMINGKQFGESVKMTKNQIKEIGVFDFVLLTSQSKTKFVFSTPKMSSTKVILAWNYQDAKKKAREYLNVKRLPNDFHLSQIYGKISEVMSVDIK